MSEETDNLQNRLAFMELDQAACARLRDIAAIVNASIGPALGRFYAKVSATPETARFFSNQQHMAHAKQKQQEHWGAIVSGKFDADYERRVSTIGNVHARLGLEPRWYVGGYALVAENLVKDVILAKSGSLMHSRKRAEETALSAGALVKAVMLDVELSISTYLAAIDERRRLAEAERQRAEHEQSLALEALGRALATIAAGDLTTEIAEDLAPQFAKLKEDFNKTARTLHDAMAQVKDGSDLITQGTQEISAAADDLSKRTEQQAASLEQTAAALDEITATVKKAAEGASHAQSVVATAKGDAETAESVVHKAVAAMGAIEKSSSQIGQIIGVIDALRRRGRQLRRRPPRQHRGKRGRLGPAEPAWQRPSLRLRQPRPSPTGRTSEPIPLMPPASERPATRARRGPSFGRRQSGMVSGVGAHGEAAVRPAPPPTQDAFAAAGSP